MGLPGADVPLTRESVTPWKLRLFFAGAFFLLLGIYLDRRPLVVAAIVTLGIAFLLRFVGRDPRHHEVHPSWFEDEDAPPDENRKRE